MSDTLDSRDLEEELNNPDTDEERKKAIKELKEQIENDSWEHGIYFVSEYEWEDYCRDVASDCGYLKMRSDTFNPLESCIDWSKWSDLMAMDYQKVDFEGKTYYCRW